MVLPAEDATEITEDFLQHVKGTDLGESSKNN